MPRVERILSNRLSHRIAEVIISSALFLLIFIYFGTPNSDVNEGADSVKQLTVISGQQRYIDGRPAKKICKDKSTKGENKATQIEIKPTNTEEPTKAKHKQTRIEHKLTETEHKPTKIEDKPTKPEHKPTKIEDKPTKPEHKPTKVEDTPTKDKDKTTKTEDKLTNSKNKSTKTEHKSKKPNRTEKTKPRDARTKTSQLYNGQTEIPHILHQAFTSEMVYENYRPFINRCLSLHPNWTYYLWRDSDAKAFVTKEYPQYLKTYLGFKDNLQRSDAIRYVILHRFGGIYLDMDVECVKPFHPVLTNQLAFIDQERLEQTRILWKRQFSAMNSLMGSVPGHAFFLAMSDRVLRKSTRSSSAVHTTGPFPLTEAYTAYQNSPTAYRWPVTLLPPEVASPLMDPQRNWKNECRKAKKFNSPNQGWLDVGCQMLEAKKWHNGGIDKGTIAVHRFLHLGYSSYKRNRRSAFNVTQHYRARVHFYS